MNDRSFDTMTNSTMLADNREGPVALHLRQPLVAG